MNLNTGEIIRLIKRDIFKDDETLTLDVWAANLESAKSRQDAIKIAERISKNNPTLTKELPTVLECIKRWS